MRSLLTVSLVLALAWTGTVVSSEEVVNCADPRGMCECDVSKNCKSQWTEALPDCSAEYGNFTFHLGEMQKLVNHHISHSFQYMMLASYFGTDKVNRIGFQKFFTKLSDRQWDAAFKLIEYINKRGGHIANSTEHPILAGLSLEIPTEENFFLITEVEALSRALDMSKELATEIHRIHRKALHHGKDAELLNFLEDEFVSQYADIIRDLAGKVAVLSKMVFHEDSIQSDEKDVALYLFDEMLLD